MKTRKPPAEGQVHPPTSRGRPPLQLFFRGIYDLLEKDLSPTTSLELYARVMALNSPCSSYVCSLSNDELRTSCKGMGQGGDRGLPFRGSYSQVKPQPPWVARLIKYSQEAPAGHVIIQNVGPGDRMFTRSTSISPGPKKYVGRPGRPSS